MHSVESSPSMLASPLSGGLATPNCVTRPNRVRMTLRLVRLPRPASAPVVAHQTLWVRLHDFRPFTMMNTFQFIRSAKLRLALSGGAEKRRPSNWVARRPAGTGPLRVSVGGWVSRPRSEEHRKERSPADSERPPIDPGHWSICGRPESAGELVPSPLRSSRAPAPGDPQLAPWATFRRRSAASMRPNGNPREIAACQRRPSCNG